MGLSKYEQEVVINFNAEEDTASVYTANPVWIRKMDKLVEKNPDEFRLVSEVKMDGVVISKVYECPKKLIAVRPKTKGKDMTDEERQAVANRFRQARNKKNSSFTQSVSMTSDTSEDV